MTRLKILAPLDFYTELSAVMTLAEAVPLYHRGRSTIRYAIDSGRLAAVRAGRDWLISVRSLNALWGAPKI